MRRNLYHNRFQMYALYFRFYNNNLLYYSIKKNLFYLSLVKIHLKKLVIGVLITK